LNLDPSLTEQVISPKTKAIIPVHFTGLPCEMDRILALAKQYGLAVIEDAAHALPAHYGERRVGTIGDITCFSFYATKNIPTGEGGMATTENPDWAERMRIMSLHGISKDAWKRYTSEGSWAYDILYPGYKYNLTDLAAAIGVEQLKKSDQFWQTRQRYAQLYSEGFQDLPEIQLPASGLAGQHAWHLYVIQLQLERLNISRGAFIEALKEHHIGASVHFIPLHLHPYYRDSFGYGPQDFPCASTILRA
jgi:perosamine synthetase